MTQEEKAKAYDEALERAKDVLETDIHESGVWAIKKIFPELKESEDERIRKALIDGVRQIRCKKGITQEQMLDWLEKQKINTEGDFGRGYDCGYKACLNSHGAEFFEKQKENPKSADSIPSDCVSDAKCENKHNEEGDFVFELRQIISSHRYSDIYGEYTNDEEGMASEILELCKCELEKQKEQKPIEFDEYKIIKKHITEDVLSSEVNKRLTECGWYVTDENPAEWSEEDEKMRNALLNLLHLHYAQDNAQTLVGIEAGKFRSWLKSLRPQSKVEEEPVDIEKILELVEKHLELFTAGNLDRRKGYTKHDMQDAFILGFKAGIKRR